MHNNYYFLRQLAAALTQQLTGYQVVTCFSQEKDELVVGLTNGAAEFWLKAQLTATFPALALPETFHRARTNSVDLLPGLLGRTVAAVQAFPHDRVLQLTFTDQATLLFKLYGPRPNAVFRPAPTAPAELFHRHFLGDADLTPNQSGVNAAAPEPLRRYPALGDVPARYLRTQGYDTADWATKERQVAQLVTLLENPPHFYLIQLDGRTRLTLLPLSEVERTLAPDPIVALRLFVPLALSRRAHETELRQLRQTLERRAEEASTSAAMARKRAYALEHEAGYRQTADLIMAHLSQIPVGAASVDVFDFYQNQPRTIKLKANEKPQLTAQNLYRKAKNQQIEQRQLQERIERREAEAFWCLEHLEELPALTDLRALRAWRKTHDLEPVSKGKEATELPFKVFNDAGFTILVGRNAQNNDLLTQRYAHKDDLWLHAKDVTGSHVVIKHRAGQTIPEPVIEHAAQLAAWYSRRQHDSLCPVTVTPKKFVRKPKGALPGQVKVEREKVVLVVPANPFERLG